MLTRFFLTAFALAWIITIPIALRTQGLIFNTIVPPPLQWLIGFAPLVAAFLFVRRTNLYSVWKQDCLRVKVPPVWFAIALVGPWLILGVSTLVKLSVNSPVSGINFSPMMAVFALVWFILAFGEEAGWRGFALMPLIKRMGVAKAIALLGVLWCVWHFPKLLCSPYLKLDGSAAVPLAEFSAQIMVANVLICYLFVRTRSVLVTTLFHASFNLVATVDYMVAMDLFYTGTLAAFTTVLIFSLRKLPLNLASTDEQNHSTGRQSMSAT